MRLRNSLLALPALLILAAGVVTSCADNEDDPMGDDDDGTGGGTGDGWECDPVGANPEMGALLNTPLDATVQVIQKAPQHPGNPGPLNLP